MQVKSIAECSKGSILQYFRPSPFVIKILVLSIFEWPLKTGVTTHPVAFVRKDIITKYVYILNLL